MHGVVWMGKSLSCLCKHIATGLMPSPVCGSDCQALDAGLSGQGEIPGAVYSSPQPSQMAR